MGVLTTISQSGMILKFAIRFSLSVAILLAVQVMGVERFAGTLTENTVWSGVIEVTNNVTVAENKTLTLVAGARVALYPKVSIQGLSGSTIQISGTHSQPVFLSGMSVPSNWAALRVSGSNSAISIRYADIQAGQVRAENGATLLIEDSFLHDSLSWIGPIVHRACVASDSAPLSCLSLRRGQFQRYPHVD